MADNFHEDAIKFMNDLLKLLNKESQSGQFGESVKGLESVYSTLLRSIGVTDSITLDADNNPENQIEVATDPSPDLINSFFKKQTGETARQLEEINRLLRLLWTKSWQVPTLIPASCTIP